MVSTCRCAYEFNMIRRIRVDVQAPATDTVLFDGAFEDETLVAEIVALAPRVARWTPHRHARCAPCARRTVAGLVRSAATSSCLTMDLVLDRLIPMVVRDVEQKWKARSRLHRQSRRASAIAFHPRTKRVAVGTRDGRVCFERLLPSAIER